jgi:ectoine hydroxylase-related dioxygenase (phytanoyl-CoA dioxygenase family)
MTTTTEIDPALNEAQPEMPKINTGSLTAAQIAEYDREGYVILPELLNAADLAPARQALMDKVSVIADQLFAEGLIKDKHEDAPFETRLVKLFENLDEKTFLRFGRSWRDPVAGYFHLIANPKIIDAVESLIGSEIFANPVYNARPKVPGVAAGAVPWHQDKSYWPNANWNPVITVWIPLVDTNLENGCLHVWPRTHKTKLVTYHADTYTGTAYTEIDLKEQADRNAVCLPMKAGSAILFNDRCIHSSTPNLSRGVRWSVDLRYQPTEQQRFREYGVGFLARSRKHPERVARVEDWLSGHDERQA